MLFFKKTEKSFITRKEMLEREPFQEVFFTSIICDENGGNREFISGVSEIQKKWNYIELTLDWDSVSGRMSWGNIVDNVMNKVRKLVDSPEDLAKIHDIVEECVGDIDTKECKLSAQHAEISGDEYHCEAAGIFWGDGQIAGGKNCFRK